MDSTESILTLSDKRSNTPIYSLILTPDGKYIIAGLQDGCIAIWNLKEQKLVYKFKAQNGIIWSLDISRDGKYLISGSEDKSIRVWNFIGLIEKMKF